MYQYPNGFLEGDRVEIIGPDEDRKYNPYLKLSGKRGVILKPPEKNYPDDAIEVRLTGGGTGKVDVDSVKLFEKRITKTVKDEECYMRIFTDVGQFDSIKFSPATAREILKLVEKIDKLKFLKIPLETGPTLIIPGEKLRRDCLLRLSNFPE